MKDIWLEDYLSITNDLFIMCKLLSHLQTSSDQFAVSEVVDTLEIINMNYLSFLEMNY